MFRNYVLTAWRNIANNRLFSAINIIGLAIGLMACIMILLFVRAETGFDTWIPGGDRVVRLHTGYFPPGRTPFETVRSAGRMMETLKAYASSEVEDGVRLVGSGTTILSDGKAFSEAVTFTDGSFFHVFDLPFAAGDAETAFAKPFDTIVDEDTAIKYFGRTDVVGETLVACCLQAQKVQLQITGVIRNLPENTHLQLGILIRMDPAMFDFAPNILKTWTSVNTYTYFKLKPGADVATFQERITYWLDHESTFAEEGKARGDAGKASDFIRLRVMPLYDLHLHARAQAGNLGDMTAMGDIQTVYAFSSVAVLILVIASINFMNLSTARGVRRAREVALRKVMGASRLQVAAQFLGEAVAIGIIALLLAFVGVELALPYYNDALGRSLSFDLLDDLPMAASLVGIALLVGFLSGSYPAIYLSRFLPAKTLRSNKSGDAIGASRFRAILVVLQFAISIGLIVCTAVIYGQTRYARTMALGYSYNDKLELLNIQRDAVAANRDALSRELLALPGVSSVVFSSEAPTQDNENNTGFTLTSNGGADEGGKEVVINYHSVGYDFFEAYDIVPVAGRTYSRAFGTEEVTPVDEGQVGNAGIVLNESAVRALGLGSPEEAVGRVLKANLFRAGSYELTIVGVVPDIYFRSIKFGVRPSVYLNWPQNFRVATVSFETNDLSGLVAGVDAIWSRLLPEEVIRHQFLRDMIAGQYTDEEAQAKMFAAFSVLAVVVACLGLYGLAAFNAEQRTKEIGIRKVLGARVSDIVRLMMWQFSWPVMAANAIAWPIAWYLMSGWLEGFQYRLGGGFILLSALVAGLVALAVAWITVAGRAARVARANPIFALRYE